jgi:hypothetical protein
MTPQPQVGTQTGATKKPPASNSTVYPYAILGGLVYFLAVLAALSFDKAGFIWIALLFAIPVAAPIVGVSFHIKRANNHNNDDQIFYNFSIKISCCCTAGYCLLWMVYTGLLWAVYTAEWFSHSVFSWIATIFSWISLAGIALLLAVLGYMTCAFLHEMDPNRWPKLSALRKGAAKEPLWALSFLFFVIFLDVAYLFGFAIAFHDQACLSINDNIPALHMVNLVSPDDISGVSNPGQDKSNSGVGGTQTKDTTSTSTEDTKFFFYFDVRRAKLTPNPNAVCEPLPDEKDAKPIRPPQRVNWILKPSSDFNRCSLRAITRLISEESKGGNRTRVILVGRSNDDPIKDEVKNGLRRESGKNSSNDDLVDYKSNYELSEARAENVRFAIAEALKVQDGDTEAWHNLEWLSLPSSNETPIEEDDVLKGILTSMSLDDNQKKDLLDKNKRVVTASVVSVPGDITSIQMKHEQPKRLRLMDYMYFSIYTITTTGYGDIIPTTAYSKFVISLANICEVLFLVVFFNALISLKSKPEPRGELD